MPYLVLRTVLLVPRHHLSRRDRDKGKGRRNHQNTHPEENFQSFVKEREQVAKASLCIYDCSTECTFSTRLPRWQGLDAAFVFLRGEGISPKMDNLEVCRQPRLLLHGAWDAFGRLMTDCAPAAKDSLGLNVQSRWSYGKFLFRELRNGRRN